MREHKIQHHIYYAPVCVRERAPSRNTCFVCKSACSATQNAQSHPVLVNYTSACTSGARSGGPADRWRRERVRARASLDRATSVCTQEDTEPRNRVCVVCVSVCFGGRRVQRLPRASLQLEVIGSWSTFSVPARCYSG